MATIQDMKPKIKKSKFQYLHSTYYKPFYRKEVKKGTDMDPYSDFLAIVYRDEDTNKKNLLIKANPTIKYCIAKDEVEINQPHLNHIELENVDTVTVQYRHLLRSIAQYKDEYEGTSTNFTAKYCKDGKENGLPIYAANSYHLYNRVFGSDIDIEDYWKGRFIDSFPEAKRTKITKAYTDIEVDSIDISGFPEPEDAICPINALTTFFEEKMMFFTLLLRNPNNPLIEEFESNVKKFIKKMKKTYGEEYHFKIKFFDDELDLIDYYFQLTNTVAPDFQMFWNMGFDLPTILNRIGELNDINRLMRTTTHKYQFQDLCAEYTNHPQYPNYLRTSEYIKDTRNQKAAERIDTYRCSSFTQYIDQLCLYASIRKGMGELESMALSYVAQKELKDDKLNYEDSGSNIKTLPYDNYEMFVEYNIKDVLLLYLLEKKNKDVDLVYMIADITKTRFHKAMRKTVSLKNLDYHFHIDQGYIPGNNFNLDYGMGSTPITESFEGAYVADPELNGYNGTIINGNNSKYIYDYVIDYDYSSLYPSIIRAFNIDPNTQYGRLKFMDEPITKDYDLGGTFMDNLSSSNIIALTNKFLNTPTIEEVLEACETSLK